MQSHFLKTDSEVLTKVLECSICLNSMMKPVVTLCGHFFCEKCFFESMMYQSICSICRTKTSILNGFACKLIEHLIVEYIKNLNTTIDESVKQRADEYNQWRDQRYVFTIEVGQKLDVLDAPDVWCKATVLKVFLHETGKQKILIHYDGWHSKFDEVLFLGSKKISPEDFVLSNKSTFNRSQKISTVWGQQSQRRGHHWRSNIS